MGGRKAEADAIRRKLADAKAREEAKISQKAATEKTAKRKAEEAAEEQEREQRKQAKTEGGPAIDLAASASAAAKGQVSDVKVDLGDKQQMELAMAYASGTASAPSAPIFRAFLSCPYAFALPLSRAAGPASPLLCSPLLLCSASSSGWLRRADGEHGGQLRVVEGNRARQRPWRRPRLRRCRRPLQRARCTPPLSAIVAHSRADR